MVCAHFAHSEELDPYNKARSLKWDINPLSNNRIRSAE